MPTETTLARIELARRNEQLVIATSSLELQRTFSLFRVGVVITLAFSQSVVARLVGHGVPLDPWRLVAGLVYTAYNVGMYFLLGRLELRSVRQIALGQSHRAVVDFLFFGFQAWRSSLDGIAFPEIASLGCALFLCMSAASFSNWIVAFADLLAILMYTSCSHLFFGGLRPTSFTFIVAGLAAVGAALALLGNHTRRMFVDLRRRDNLTRFLAPQVAERVMKLGALGLVPVQREATVLFSDIRDFTTLSESLQPREVLELLDEYFGHMSQIVKVREGIVNKFLGDGLLAFWNLPDTTERHAELAIRAALDMRLKLVELNEHRSRLGKPVLRIGIGIHTGMVAAGMLGGADQHEYTVIGDAVNVASRIEGLTKKIGVDVLVSERTWALAGASFRGRSAGEEHVKGRSEPVTVYAIDPA